MNYFQSIFPYNQSLIAEYPLMDDKAVAKAIEKSATMFTYWKQTSFQQRADLLLQVAALLHERKQSLATLISNEMGKVLKEAIAEVEKCAWVCEYYAHNAESFLQDEIILTNYTKSFVTYEPIGAVLAVMPWNFPFWQVFRFAVPTLMAGNVALLKHAHNVSGCALAIEKLFIDAGLEPGIFQSLIIKSDLVEQILKADIVQAVSLTGSEYAGSKVAAIAAVQIKKSVLELGGADAFIVLSDADISKSASAAVASRMQNAGQSCIAAKRFIVDAAVKDVFIEEVIKNVTALKQGNPFDASVTTGPMASQTLAAELHRQMQTSVEKGAAVLLGGNVEGANYQPAVLLNVQPGMPAFDEETFGPLMNISIVQNEQEAVQIANTHRYGLSNNIWTNDTEKAVAIARQLQSGAVFINSFSKSEPALPFGGIKKSGYGRELGIYGIREFVNIKTIAVA